MSSYLVTGGAGFIGSHLAEELIRRGQRVRVIDSLITGKRQNLKHLPDVEFVEGDLADFDACARAVKGVDYVLHQAAIPSVPRSVKDPITSNRANIDGSINILVAARDAGVKRLVYAGSSSAYGDTPTLPKREDMPTNPLSPYALQKLVAEQYCQMFTRLYGFETVTIRYFNVFGPRQDPDGPYASVIPAWIGALLRGETAYVNGDGSAARDYCHVDNVVQANLLAAMVDEPQALGQCYNVAVGEQTTLSELFQLMRAQLAQRLPHLRNARPVHREPRRGDVLLSRADVSKAARLLGYRPGFTLSSGLAQTIDWYIGELLPAEASRAAHA